MTPKDIRYTVSSLPMQAGSVPAPSPSPSPSPVAALENVPSTMVVGTPAAAQVRNTGTVPASWALTSSSGSLTVSPASGTLSPGATQALALNAVAAATYTLTLSVTGGAATGSPATITAGAVTLTFAVADTGVVGVAAAGSIVNTGSLPAGAWSIAAVAGLTISPSSGSSIAAGATVPLTITPSTAGARDITLTCAGAVITGNPQNLAVAAAPQLALVAGQASATVGVAATGWRVDNTGSVSAAWAVASSPADVTVSPSSGTLAAGANVAFTLTALVSGSKSISLTSSTPGAVISGSPAPFAGTGSPPPPSPTTATLSLPSTATTGVAINGMVTLDALAASNTTCSLAISDGGTLTPPSPVVLAGQASIGFTASWPAAGAGRTVSLNSTSPSLTPAGTPRSVTVSDPPPSESGNWTSRKTAPKIVWAHRFDSDAEVSAFKRAATTGGGHAGPAVEPFRVADPTVGYAIRFIALGGRLAADFPASGGAGPRPLELEDDYLWPDPAAINPATGNPYGTYDVHLCKPNGGQINNLVRVSAKSGRTLTVTWQNVSGQPFTNGVQTDWVVGDFIGAQNGANWTREFSALKADSNGIGVDDINGTGNVLRSKLDQTNFPHGTQAFGYGWYMHPDLQAEHPTWRPSDHGAFPIDSILRSNLHDGHGFAISWRQRIDPSFLPFVNEIVAYNGDNRFGRKMVMLQSTMTVPQQITMGYGPGRTRFQIPTTDEPTIGLAAYSHSGGLAGRTLTNNLDSSGTFQPGSAKAGTALFGVGDLPAGAAYENPAGEWTTFQLKVKPGHRWQASNPSATGVRDTAISLKFAKMGDAAWTTAYDVTDQAIVFGSSGPAEDVWTSALPGYNAFSLTGYLNVDLGNVPPPRSYYVDFGEILFLDGDDDIMLPTPVPSYVPPAGDVVSYTAGGAVLTNNYRDTIAPWYETFYAVSSMNDYSSVVPNPWWGKWGGDVVFGDGGHAGTNHNGGAVRSLNDDTISWVSAIQGTGYFGTGTDQTTKDRNGYQQPWSAAPYVNIVMVGEPGNEVPVGWADPIAGLVAQFQAPSSHSYTMNTVVGGEVGGARFGTWLRSGHKYILGAFSASVGGAHRLDLPSMAPNTAVPARAADDLINVSLLGVSGGGFATYVPRQKRRYLFNTNTGANVTWQTVFVKNGGAHLSAPVVGGGTSFAFNDPNSGIALYIPERDLIVALYRAGGFLVVQAMDVSVAQPTALAPATLSMALPLENATAWQHAWWCKYTNEIGVGAILNGGVIDTAAYYGMAIPSTLTNTWPVTRRPWNNGTMPWSTGTGQRPTYHEKARALIYQAAATRTGNDVVHVARLHNT